ncbi:hypothetical protein ACP70R_014583 [Stipagrostis hirtigluma subsp. patula]
MDPPEEIIETILLRFRTPPASSTHRSSASSVPASSAAPPSAAGRFREFHISSAASSRPCSSSPPLTPPTTSPCRHRSFDNIFWIPIHSCHGRVAVLDTGPRDTDDTLCSINLIVWNPLSGERHHVPAPEAAPFTVAVLWEGCDRPARLPWCPFLLVFASTSGANWGTQAYVYSAETGPWSEPASTQIGPNHRVGPYRRSLAGNAIYFTAVNRAISPDNEDSVIQPLTLAMVKS